MPIVGMSYGIICTKEALMPVNFTFLMIYMLPVLSVGLALLVYGVVLLIGEVIGWVYGR